ncbi:hypothetical protein F2P56_012820 [Juglans regia]|uniref:Uncharacterized protein LOC108986530 n=2 Tax=Juglans regia TaxID=51240 RepID=A0A2I4E5P7_JUGRE|nr:uncharacterized protein LOC108986530 [Juglans regia]KAF5468683.1 hypothetical protein F2P56_012820 [Juglans regia]
MSGELSSKSAWECIRVRVSILTWSGWIWNAALPKKYSVTMWKAIKFCLSVDARMRSLGIPLVSKCECCVRGSLEDQDHILATRMMATEIWRRASLHMGISFAPNRPWKEKMELWFRHANHVSQRSNLFGLVPVILTWSLWVWRCQARMEGKVKSVESLWLASKSAIAWVGLWLKAGSKTKAMSSCEVEKPSKGWLKLHVDVSCLGNSGLMGAVGVIRDDGGRMNLAFMEFLDHGTNNVVELMALLHGLRQCRNLGIQKVEVELDSLLIVNWLEKMRCGIWYLEDYWEEILGLLSSMQFVFRHIYREGNAGADFLARMASGRLSGFLPPW